MLSEKYRSSIHSPLLKKALLQGSCLAGLGAFLLLTGTFLPLGILKVWGPFIFLISLALIGWGLIPYRRLKQLETEPHEILLSNNQLLFCWRKKPVFAIQLEGIKKAVFISSRDGYGIGVSLIDSSLRYVQICDEKFDITRFQQQSIKRYGCDLFLPYFSERTFQLMNLNMFIFPTE